MKRVRIDCRCVKCGREGPQMVTAAAPRCGFCGGGLLDADGRSVGAIEVRDATVSWSGAPFSCPVCDRIIRPDKLKKPLCGTCGATILTELGQTAAPAANEALERFGPLGATLAPDYAEAAAPAGDPLWAAAFRSLSSDRLSEEERATIGAGLAILRSWKSKWNVGPGSSPLSPEDTIGVAMEFALRGQGAQRFRHDKETAGVAIPVASVDFLGDVLEGLFQGLAMGAMIGLAAITEGAVGYGRDPDEGEQAKAQPKLIVRAQAVSDGSVLSYLVRSGQGGDRPISGRQHARLSERVEGSFNRGAALLWFVRSLYGLWAEPSHVNMAQPKALERKLTAVGEGRTADIVRMFVEEREALRAVGGS